MENRQKLAPSTLFVNDGRLSSVSMALESTSEKQWRPQPDPVVDPNAWKRYAATKNAELAKMMESCEPLGVRNSSKGPHRVMPLDGPVAITEEHVPAPEIVGVREETT